MPLRNYSERLRVIPISDEDKCVVELIGSFSTPEGTTEDMQSRISNMYKAAIVGIREYVEKSSHG
jgi:hypothetical protein